MLQRAIADRNKIKVILPSKNLTFAHKRLLKDIQQIQNDPIPLCGVSARPLETNIFVWHANLRGPKKSRFEGGVFHIQIKFPQSYPSHPPTIRALSYIVHPNVFGGYFCLDFLNLSKEKHSYSSYEWNPTYSVQSILYQMQGFLKNQNLPYEEAPDLPIVTNSNLFRCGECKHKGAADPWPTFDENDSQLGIYRMNEETLKLECSQLKCFYTKLSFTENQLGLGLKVSKIPKTGLIKEAIIFQDFISIKAYLKQRINLTSKKEIISHWIPLYFGKVDCQEKFFYFLKKSLSMIMTNSTKYFKPEFILQVFPKILINLVYQLMDRNKYLSISLIRIFTDMHSMFLYCIKQHPQLQFNLKQSLQKFKENEEYRNKDHTPNLGCFLAYLLVTDKFQFADIIQQYFGEQLDRHVFWILQGVPQLISPELSENADSVRNELAFNCQKTSFHIICFYKLYLSHCAKRGSKAEMLEQYEENLCRLKTQEENQLQNQIFDIFKKVKSFQDYFRFVGLPEKNEEQVNYMLRQAIKNSERKGYHSRQDITKWEERMNLKKIDKNNVGSSGSSGPKKINIQQQIIQYYDNIPSYQKYIKVKFPSQADENSLQKVEYAENENREEDWKELCLERWVWIKQCLITDHSLEAGDISQLAFEFYKKGTATSGQRLYKLHSQYQDIQKVEQPAVSVPSVSWKQLFLRLDLQDFLKHIDISTNFPKFYQKLYICCKNEVNTLLIPIIQVQNLKSGYFYITALLSRLTTLKYIEFVCLDDDEMKLHDKIAKAIGKGLHNFYQKNGKLQFLSFINVNAEKDISDHIFKKGYFSSTIKAFRMDNSNLLAFPSAIKHFTSLAYPDLEEISIKRCQMSSPICKTLADLLVKLKKLKIFRMNNEKNLKNGLSTILSNLAFNSAVRVIDIGETTICDHSQANYITDDFIENLGKLIKINSNLEYLFLNDIPRLNQRLTIQFWKNLGLSIGLKVLDVSSKIPNNSLGNNLQNLGRAVAFNGKKKGSLQQINFSGCISGFQSIEQLYKGMMISEYEEQEWYGSPKKLKEMIAENYDKVFYNRLHLLNFASCTNLDMPFSLKQHQQLFNAEDPLIVKMIADSQILHTLNLKRTGLSSNFANLLYLGLDQKREGLRSQLKVLNLSRNMIGSEGACTLASVLRDNRIIQVLDLSKTGLGVNGIHKISTALSQNQSLRYLNVFNNNIGFDGAKSIAQNIITKCGGLQFLEIGHNRIRSKGLSVLIDHILGNSESKIKILGLRFNFLSNMAIISSIRKLAEGRNNSLRELFLRNNLIDDFGVSQLREIVDSRLLRISIDILDKSKFLDKQRADKTVWIYPIHQLNIHQFKDFFENTHECGIITNIRIRMGKQIPNKKGENKFCFVEFASPQSASAALSLAANNQTEINGVKFRIFKSGSGTFVYRKKSAKRIKREAALLSLPQIGLPVPQSKRKKVAIPKPKKAVVNTNNGSVVQAELKCEERYLDQIKPLSNWRKKLARGIIIAAFIIFAYMFLWPGMQEEIPTQAVPVN